MILLWESITIIFKIKINSIIFHYLFDAGTDTRGISNEVPGLTLVVGHFDDDERRVSFDGKLK